MRSKSVVGRGLVMLALLGGCRTTQGARDAAPPPVEPRTVAGPVSTGAPPPKRSATKHRLVSSGLMLEAFASRFGRKDTQAVPAEVIEQGAFRYVPYFSYSSDRFELNIYGDGKSPAAVEIGVYAGKEKSKEQVRELISLLLENAADREVVNGLSLEKDKVERDGLTFEVTPATAEDAFGGWWISIYDAKALQEARVGGGELENISTPVASHPRIPVPRAQAELSEKRRKAAQKEHAGEKPERVYIPDYSRENGVYVNPEQ